MSSSLVPVVTNGKILFFLWLSNIPLHTHALQLLHPFIHLWTLRSVEYLGYGKQCCSEHEGTYIALFECVFVHLEGELQFFLKVFWANSVLIFIVATTVYVPTSNALHSPFSTSLSTCVISCLFLKQPLWQVCDNSVSCILVPTVLQSPP